MGSELSREGPRGPVELEAHLMTEGDLGEQLVRKPSSETVEACSIEGSTSQSALQQQQQEACSFCLPAEELGPQELPKNSQDGGHPPSCSQGSSLDKGHRTNGQTRELEAASSQVEHSDEQPPRTQLEAAGEPEAESGVILFVLSTEAVELELQVTAENLHCLAESQGQRRPSERSTSSPAKEHRSEICNFEDGSFEIIADGRPERAASEMAEGPSDMTTTQGTEQLQAQSSAKTESTTTQTAGGGLIRAEVDPLPIAETEAGQGKVHSAVDARIPEEGEGQAASEPPEEADQKSPLARQALDALEKPPASNGVGHGGMNADRKFFIGIQNDGGYLTTEAGSLREEQPAAAPVCDPEAEPLLGHLADPSSKALRGSNETKDLLGKEMNATYSGPKAIEMRETRVSKLNDYSQMLDGSSPLEKLAPVAQEMQPLAKTDVHAQVQDCSGAQKDSAEDPAHVQKQQARFRKSFYLCCSQCSVGDEEGNAKP
ncbi:uncharacterized protein LOC143821886 [Paroedura picta]|uniref:uncharacterized protein LOC143821886 n=1 Tax=Paroedura picta TaxID=143630 RepID=UPI0040575C3E